MGREKKSGPVRKAKNTMHTLAERFGKGYSRAFGMTGAGCIGSVLVGLGKLLMGILSLSFFTCVNAFYTFGMVLAKLCVLRGLVKEDDLRAQYRCYNLAGTILVVSSLLYLFYSLKLFFFPVDVTYHMYVAIGIAAFTFFEIGINIRGVIVERRQDNPLFHAVKMINLASSFICLVLTQTALLSFASEEASDFPQANGLISVLMGAVATAIGILMLARSRKMLTRPHSTQEDNL